jgi:hypothetical protein
VTARCWSQHVWVGHAVVDACDPRHVGLVEAVHWSTTARVRWFYSGWISEISLANLRRLTWQQERELVADIFGGS